MKQPTDKKTKAHWTIIVCQTPYKWMSIIVRTTEMVLAALAETVMWWEVRLAWPKPQIGDTRAGKQCPSNQAFRSQLPLNMPVPDSNKQRNISTAAVRQMKVGPRTVGRRERKRHLPILSTVQIYEVYFSPSTLSIWARLMRNTGMQPMVTFFCKRRKKRTKNTKGQFWAKPLTTQLFFPLSNVLSTIFSQTAGTTRTLKEKLDQK